MFPSAGKAFAQATNVAEMRLKIGVVFSVIAFHVERSALAATFGKSESSEQ